MALPPPLDTLPIDSLRAVSLALRGAVAAGYAIGNAALFEAALLIDAEGVTVVFTVPFGPDRDPAAFVPSAAGNLPEAGAAASGDLSNPETED